VKEKAMDNQPEKPAPKVEFSRYQLGEITKPYVPPKFLTVPDPEQPLLRLRHHQPPGPMVKLAKTWFEAWQEKQRAHLLNTLPNDSP
jgi:hypothetical protein